MKVKRTAALLLAILMVVMVCLCGCNNSEQTKKAEETQAPTQVSSAPAADSASSQIGSGENYSSSAGTDMSGSGNSDIMTGSFGEVKLKNTLNWATPYVYYWSDTNINMIQWPGSAMTKETDGTYTFTLPAGVEYIIFNDGNETQTVDTQYDGSVAAYQIASKTDKDGKYYMATWDGKVIEEAKKFDSTQNVTNSTLAVSVEKAGVIDEYYKNSYATNGGNDAVVFTVKNNTNETIKQMTIYVVFVDASGNTIKPFGSYNMSNDINVLSTQYLLIEPGETKEIPYRCDADQFEKFDSVVASYMIGRTKYENTDADTWAAKYIK